MSLPGRPSPASTLLELLETRASAQREQPLYTFLEDGDEQVLSYGALDLRARRIGAMLQSVARAGERAVLLYPPGLEYVAGFFGCVYAGLVAVPAYPPEPSRLERTLPRLRAIIRDARASVVLTTSFIREMGESLFEQAPELAALRWVATDAIDEGTEAGWRRPEPARDSLAFLQYTSGSTGEPKGVRLSHGNLLHNLSLISHAFEVRPESVGVIWLPPYHDMGLIGGILQPLYAGFHTALMSPLAFLRRPRLWLEALSRFGGTISGGPCFAFDLCVRKVPPPEREGLDLSRWELAFCGAEPIRPEVMTRFAQAFAPAGFRPESFYPCYGLAEGTLIASGGKKGQGMLVRTWDASALERNEAVEAVDGPGARPLVGCGRVMPEQSLVIVDPETRRPCPEGRVGEIWLSGPSVAQGYWERAEENEATFQATVVGGGAERFLRTGDLGVLHGGELFVVGRRKDLIILRGRNLHPQDLELVLERSHPALRPGCGAAFSIEVEGEERLAVVQEVDPRKPWTPDEVVGAIRKSLSEAHEVQLHALVLLEPGALPKTSSGKIQRRACRAELLAGWPRALLFWREAEGVARDLSAPVPEAPASPVSVEELETWLVARISARLRVRPEELAKDVPITSFGLDSLAAVELAHDLEHLGAVLRMDELLQGPTVAALARTVFASRGTSGDAGLMSIPRRPEGTEAPLSSAQQRLWLFEQLERGKAAYNLPSALRLVGVLDEDALERSFTALLERHEILRATFREADGAPRQIISSSPPPVFRRVDLQAVPAPAREDEALRLAREEASAPFDLSRGPLLRVTLIRLDAREHLLVVVMHHIVSDGASFSLLARELSALYAAFAQGTSSSLQPLPVQYPDYALWRRERDTGAALAEPLSWWRQRLAGASAALDLPTDRPRPPSPSYRGARVALHVPESLTARLDGLGRGEGATLFMTLLSAFQVLLLRHSGQEDLCVGTPVNGRDRASLEGVIGCFLELLVLRTSLSGDPSFRELLARTRTTSLEAFAHRDVPFERIVETVLSSRDRSRSPLFQVLFVLLPEPGAELALPGLDARRVELDPGATAYDLTLSLARGAKGLEGWIEYATDLYDAATVTRMAERLLVVLDAICANPDQRLSSIPLLPEHEWRQLLVDWNATRTEYPEACVHALFSAQAALMPDALAVVCGDESLTYRELDQRANAVARRLRARGVGPEVVVGLCAERSLELVTGLLGILKAGGAYLPLDPSYPESRLAFMLEDSGASVVLAHRHRMGSLPSEGRAVVPLDPPGVPELADDAPASGVGPDNLAYILYTSGSTGRPKGVLIPHRNLANFFTGMDARIGAAPGSWLAVTSVSFDISVLELLWTLARGFKVVVQDEQGALGGTVLAQMRRHGITHLQCTPSLAQTLLLEPQGPAALAGLSRLLVGGEALPAELAARLRGAAGGELLNMYGPTETTIWSSTHRVEGTAGPVPIGTPIANTALHVLDSRLRPAPIGVPGELFISGAGVARGYHARPELTAERFLPDPFSAQAGARMYRTGDLARWRADGTVEFIGRVDHQVKIRGFRVEPGEIEAALEKHPGVRQAVVVAREEPGGGARLVAFFIPRPEEAPSLDALRAFTRQLLPEHLVPSVFMVLDAFPLTPNGKVDRKALPALDVMRDAAREHVAPRTHTERRVAEIWSSVLGIERIGAGDDFFALGGHSLLAARAVSRLRESFGVELALRELFDAGTVAALAARIDALPKTASGAPPLVPVSREGALPLSFAQQRLWFLEQLDPQNAAYNEAVAVRVEGRLDVAVLERCLLEVVRRHMSLRSTFRAEEGKPVQLVSSEARLPLARVDLSALPDGARDEAVSRLTGEEALRPFDLVSGPPLRASLLHLGEREHVLIVVIHHLVSDGWSLGVLVREVAALYPAFSAGEPSPLPELALQYVDYAAWQREWLSGEALEAQLAYWRARLEGAPRSLELPTDHPRPAVRGSRGASRHAVLDPELSQAVKALAHREGATPFMVLLAGFSALLSRYSGQDDLCVGTPVAGRGRTDLEGLIGCFVNTLVLRVSLSGNPSFRELLGRARETVLEAFTHQDAPFEKLVEVLQPERDLGRSPLFQVMLVLQEDPLPEISLPGLQLRALAQESHTSKFDLRLILMETGEGLAATLEFSTELFEPATAERMLAHLRVLLESAVREPAQRIQELPLLTPGERHQVLVAWNDTLRPREAEACLHRLIEAQVDRTPDAVAVSFEGAQLTYRELDRRGNQLAHYLRARGVGPDRLVALCAERSLEMVVGLLGILKAGGAYVPLDPDYPRERLEYMLADAAAPVLLTQARLATGLPRGGAVVVCLDSEWEAVGREPADRPEVALSGGNLAYVIYTSGSTGRPKGAMNTHAAICNRLLWMQEAYGLGAEDRVLQKTPFSFDVSVWEFFWPLLTGARLVMARPGAHRDPALLAGIISSERITTLHFVPSMLRHFLEAPELEVRTSPKRVICSGEALSPELRELFHARLRSELHNLYGPTEAAVDVTAWACAPEDRRPLVPIGRPIANTRMYVLDPHLRLVPPGVPGELYIGGVPLARGYWRRPELTAERFIPDPFAELPGGRLYRTGDRARFLADGSIEYLGRLDEQVKVRGLRIELGEIESALLRHPHVRTAVVVVREDVPGDRRLVAYVVPGGEAPAPTALRSFLGSWLPEYMVPSAFVVLERLPLTPSGKVDRRALPAPSEMPGVVDASQVAPLGPVEELLAGLFAELLGVARVGAHDSFFELGGHSLLATRVVSRVLATFGVALSLREFFEAPTVARLAERISAARQLPETVRPPPLVPVPREGPLPLSLMQERLWLLEQLQPGTSLYNMSWASWLEGPLHLSSLEYALSGLLQRHEALRTTFVLEAGEPVQRIHPQLELPLPLVDLRELPEAEAEAQALLVASEEARRPFDLARGPLIRALLLRTGETKHLLVLSLHHIISDGWSLGVAIREFLALYEARLTGQPSPLPVPVLQPVDHAVWQRGWLRGEALETQLGYWRGQLAGAPPVLELPTDFPRPGVQRFRGASLQVHLPAALSSAFRVLCRREGVTSFMGLLAAFQLLLSRSSGQEDVCVGSPISGRHHPGLEALLGFFVNTLVLRTRLSPELSFRELLGRVRETTLGAYAHQDLPFEKLVEALQPPRSLSHAPLVQAVLALQETPRFEGGTTGLSFRPVDLGSDTAKFDLTLSLADTPEGFTGRLEYDADLFTPATAARMMEHLRVLLEGAVADPGRSLGELPMMDEAERRRLLVEWNATHVDYPRDACLSALFEAQAERTPDAVAVELGDERLTYRELDRRANQLARHLLGRGVGPGTPVGLCVRRSLELVVGTLGILKAGGAYVPLDPTYPRERLAFMVEDTRVPVVLTQRSLLPVLPESGAAVVLLDEGWSEVAREPEDSPGIRVPGEALAYVMYTSGSTGRPKGVCIPQRAVARLVLGSSFARWGPDEVFLQLAPICFDAATLELWGTLLHGARLVLFPPSPPMVDELKAVLDRHGVTTLWLTAALFEQISAMRPEALRGVRRLLAGGDVLPPAAVRERLSGGGVLVNGYGPTENTTFTTCHVMEGTAPEGAIPIGRPIANTRVYVVDRQLRPVPVGVPGELLMGGDGLAWGYLGRPDLTAERFIPDPFGLEPGGRLYRSGDRVRHRADGTLEFLGRLDAQVKIRGFRVEPGEVEEALRQHPCVAEAVVVARPDPAGGKRLVAYAVPRSGQALEPRALRTFLAERLPEYMVPAALMPLPSLPLSPNGKVDRGALPEPEVSRPAGVEFVEPTTPLERRISELLAKVLGVERVGVEDHFFADLGGNSLSVVKACALLREELKRDVPATRFFEHSTVRALAASLERGGEAVADGQDNEVHEDRAEQRRQAFRRQGRRRDRGNG